MDNNKSIRAWHDAERRIIKKYQDEYDEVRISYRDSFSSERAKNKARRDVIQRHYEEFRRFLTEERANQNLDKFEDKFKVIVNQWRLSKAPEYLIESEIEKVARQRAKILLRSRHYEEFKKLRDTFASWSIYSMQTARNNADYKIIQDYKDEYDQFLKDTREQLKELVEENDG